MRRNNLWHITLLVAILLWAGLVQAQESVNASGGDATGSGGSVSYSIGQVIYLSGTGSNGSIAQGVQQALEIFTLGINETELNMSLSIFPNPTADNLILQIRDYSNQSLSYQLFNIQGKQLVNGQIVAQQTQIVMNSLPPATYFINVVNHENKKVQSFKIIKK